MPRVPRLRAPGAHYGKLCASACRSVHRFFVYLLRLILKNSLRHKLRTILTVVGIVVAITAFGPQVLTRRPTHGVPVSAQTAPPLTRR